MKNAKRVIALVLGLSVLGLAVAAQDEMTESATIERIKPIGQVNTGGAVVVKAGGRSGKEIFESTCAACHSSGVLGAPKVGSKADWAPRLKAGGIDGMVKSAIQGKNAMPPKGGDDSLSAAELKAAIVYMTK